MSETLTKIWNVLKSVQGIVVSSIAILAIGSSVLLRHDAKIIQEQNAKVEQITDHSLIQYLQLSDSINKNNWSKLNLRLDDISDSLNNNSHQTGRMKGSIDMLATKVSKSIEEYKKIVLGAEFELVQPEPVRSVFPDTKIHIIKKDSVK